MSGSPVTLSVLSYPVSLALEVKSSLVASALTREAPVAGGQLEGSAAAGPGATLVVVPSDQSFRPAVSSK